MIRINFDFGVHCCKNKSRIVSIMLPVAMVGCPLNKNRTIIFILWPLKSKFIHIPHLLTNIYFMKYFAFWYYFLLHKVPKTQKSIFLQMGRVKDHHHPFYLFLIPYFLLSLSIHYFQYNL